MGLIDLPRVFDLAPLEICIEYVPVDIARRADSTAPRIIAEKKF
jgi:hypothetical protein